MFCFSPLLRKILKEYLKKKSDGIAFNQDIVFDFISISGVIIFLLLFITCLLYTSFLEVLQSKMKDSSIAIILVTTKLVDMCPDIISEIKLKQQKPLITEIPDRHGNSKIGETIDGYVSEAIGVKL